MLDKIAKVVARFDEIEMQMTDPAVLADHVRLTELAQERSDLQPLTEAYRQYREAEEELAGAKEMLALDDPDMVNMAEEEIKRLESYMAHLRRQMRSYLVPKDPRDNRNVFVEIRAGTGGDEATIFAADLLRMYTRYAENQGWRTELVDENATGVGGYKEAILAVRGRGAYSHFKFESGVHRVQRVPQTESQGR
ncbi:MAG: PCRF domain-containing protein, partial [Chloroflexota bacterium]